MCVPIEDRNSGAAARSLPGTSAAGAAVAAAPGEEVPLASNNGGYRWVEDDIPCAELEKLANAETEDPIT